MQGDKAGWRKEEGKAKKELIDLQEDSAEFSRDERFAGCPGYVYMPTCRLKDEQMSEIKSQFVHVQLLVRNTECLHVSS